MCCLQDACLLSPCKFTCDFTVTKSLIFHTSTSSFIGGLYGRVIGRVLVDLYGGVPTEDSVWMWIDPGALALIGAASFFGGVSRLTMSLTVIMVSTAVINKSTIVVAL